MQQECCASAEKAFKSTSKKTYALTAQNSNTAKDPKEIGDDPQRRTPPPQTKKGSSIIPTFPPRRLAALNRGIYN
jgi:hypothetical protein